MELDRLGRLTPRERDCLRSFWKHGSVSGVAIEIDKSVSTVEKHLHSARTKLGINRSIDGARLIAVAEGLDVYGPPSRRLTATDLSRADRAFPSSADCPTEVSAVRDAAAFRPWLTQDEAIGDEVGPLRIRIALTLGERLALIGKRAVWTVGGFALLLLVALVLQRLVRSE